MGLAKIATVVANRSSQRNRYGRTSIRHIVVDHLPNQAPDPKALRTCRPAAHNQQEPLFLIC